MTEGEVAATEFLLYIVVIASIVGFFLALSIEIVLTVRKDKREKRRRYTR